MRRVQAAALAPANPSPQDLAVAAMAARTMAEAQRALIREQLEAAQTDTSALPARTSAAAQTTGPDPASRVARAYGQAASAPGRLFNLIA